MNLLDKANFGLVIAKRGLITDEEFTVLRGLSIEPEQEGRLGKVMGYSVSDYAIASWYWLGNEGMFHLYYDELDENRQFRVMELEEELKTVQSDYQEHQQSLKDSQANLSELNKWLDLFAELCIMLDEEIEKDNKLQTLYVTEKRAAKKNDTIDVDVLINILRTDEYKRLIIEECGYLPSVLLWL